MKPEVIFLRPLHGETRRETAWQCLMVEFGIHFAFDGDDQLPDRLPDDMTGVKAVCIDPASWVERQQGETGRRLKAFADAGGVVFPVRGPEQFDAIDENAIRGDVDMMIASANVTLNHPALRSRLQARTFRQLYDSLRDSYFLGQVELGLQRGPDSAFNEPFAYLLLQTMEQFAEYDPQFGWHDRLRAVLDMMLAMRMGEPENLDRSTGLDVFSRMTQRTGDRRYLEFASRMIRQVLRTSPRVEGVPILQPGRDRVLWNECLAHLSPPCVAVAALTGETDLMDFALHTAHTLHRLNYDPKQKLWVHWGLPDRRCPAIWARGQGWALVGLIGILRHLPACHPDRPAIIRYVDEIVDGLRATQDDEGLWHNVMDDPRTRVCCRASAMFVYLLAEARRKGWIKPERVDELLHRGWKGVRGRVWKDKLCCVCCGTGAGATWQHYASRPMLFYGVPAALRAGCSYTLAFGD